MQPEFAKHFPTLQTFKRKSFEPTTDQPPMPSCIVRWRCGGWVNYALFLNNQLRQVEQYPR